MRAAFIGGASNRSISGHCRGLEALKIRGAKRAHGYEAENITIWSNREKLYREYQKIKEAHL
jgi:hypothetical protein